MKSKKFFTVVYEKLGRYKHWGHTVEDSDIYFKVDIRLKGKKLLEIINHESLHLLFPELSEKEIIEKSIYLTNTLWKEGFRKVDNTNDIPLQDNKKYN